MEDYPEHPGDRIFRDEAERSGDGRDNRTCLLALGGRVEAMSAETRRMWGLV